MPYESCTSTLQKWHQPSRKRKLNPCTSSNIKFVKEEYGKHKKQLSGGSYDPRPSSLISTTSRDVVSLQQQLQQLGTPVALLHVLPLSVTSQSNSAGAFTRLPPIPRSSLCKVHTSLQQQPKPLSVRAIYNHGLQFLDMICHAKEDTQVIEEATRTQSSCARWFEERYGRITSSTFGSVCKGGMTTSKV